jgi:hypothetical protein
MSEPDYTKLKALAEAHLSDLRTACETTFPGQGDFAFCTAITAVWSFLLDTYAPEPLITELNLWLLPAGWRVVAWPAEDRSSTRMASGGSAPCS